VVQLAGKDAVTPAVPGQEDHLAPASLPVSNSSDGGPKGVLTLTHFWFVNPSM